MSKKLFVRHGHSKANIRGGEAFGRHDAELTADGIEQSLTVPASLSKFGIDVTRAEVAASTMRRAIQTAEVAGAILVVQHSILDEVTTGATSYEQFAQLNYSLG